MVKKKEGVFVEPLLTRPETVSIVALGFSSRSFVQSIMTDTAMAKPPGEVWAINRGFRAFSHDKLFIMDDLRWLEGFKPDYAKTLKKHDKPIITSTAYDDYPMTVAYPYEEVLETIGDDIFNVNTVAYAVAYAIHIGVREVSIYGADFSYPNGSTAESGGQAVAFLCGLMRYFKMTHKIPQDSTLLYANKTQLTGSKFERPPYGYHRKEEMKKDQEREASLNARREKSKGK